ncbi:DNA helicase RecQ [Adlercreutzia sp. R25]|uniref:DNA helicase RecQ n=1 Tax=Adlercreutzia shanghongiae TaxID=3111773 RepID=UPI002DBF7023|nr:DNA helicase RecQ [Adlercreutzia sp. R25]MEC4272912.1 DNA helicase RecQ [Adlercreutzia sp. R25]
MELAAMKRAQQVLAERFGYDEFRPGQKAVVSAVLEGRDVLAVMPTGAGKSVCYQVPAVAADGLALVISPLVSLMADQVRAVQEAGIRGAYLNSTLTLGQQAEVLRRAEAGAYDLMYVAPERLADPRFAEFAERVALSLLAVDEAHCVSQWGQDFRPSYLAIGDFITSLPTRPVVAALTATATSPVRRDIARLLGLRDPVEVVTGFDRPNLRFAVERHEPKRKLARLDAFIDERRAESGIVYCAKRATVEEVCDHLREQGIAATRYHAGLPAAERERNQRAFVNDEAPVMVATNAFGMGIDKSNVSYVAHFNMPGSMEAYYQEAGRAGRDGQPADCLLLWCDGDIATGRFFIEQESAHEGLTPEEAEVVRASRRRMLESMVGYCYTTGCLRAYLLRYLGEDVASEGRLSQGGAAEEAPASSLAKRCCSNCAGEFEAVDVTAEARAVMRCVQALRGRFGKTTVVDVLRGADTESLRQWGLTGLPVYGACEARRPLLMEVVELLAADGYLAITEGKFPLVGFGPRYREAAEPDFSLTMKQTPKVRKGAAAKALKVAKRAGATELSAEGQVLFERLRALRLRLAQEAAVPPYVIFHDATLAAMAAARPATESELLALPGVGEKKLATYGKAFLEAMASEVEAAMEE